MTDKEKMIALAVMGMRCWKCKKQIPGALILREPHTPETVGKMLTDMGILAQCEQCLRANPYYIEFKGVQESQ